MCRTCLSNTLNRCSIGLRSGEFGEQVNTSNSPFSSSNHSWPIFFFVAGVDRGQHEHIDWSAAIQPHAQKLWSSVYPNNFVRTCISDHNIMQCILYMQPTCFVTHTFNWWLSHTHSPYMLGDTTTLGPHGPRFPPAAAATSMVVHPCGEARHL